MNFCPYWLVGASAFLLAACGGGGGGLPPTVTITPPAAYVTPGQQVQLTATVTDGAGNTLTAPVTWASSNTAVATVNSAGLVMAVTSGLASVTATSQGQSAVAYISILELVVPVSTASAGNNHTCALTTTGRACCWGDNSSGQLGDNTGINNYAPLFLSSFPIGVGLPIFSSISAGGNHTCAIQQGGAAFCWGDNSSGELGNGTTTTSAGPVPVSGGQSLETVSAGAATRTSRRTS
jgi:alpha-tubulin suppressor-like RCC1 family protein